MPRPKAKFLKCPDCGKGPIPVSQVQSGTMEVSRAAFHIKVHEWVAECKCGYRETASSQMGLRAVVKGAVK